MKFLSSGDLGDIVWLLATVHHFHKLGKPCELIIETASKGNRSFITQPVFDLYRPLLELQPCVKELLFSPTPFEGKVDFDMSIVRKFLKPIYGSRSVMNGGKVDPLPVSISRVAGLQQSVIDEPWLFVEPTKRFKYILSRSPRNHNPFFKWRDLVHHLGESECAFVGTQYDHALFLSQTRCDVPLFNCSDFLELASIIAGCETLVCNQSFPHALGEAMKVPLILEGYPFRRDCNFKRERVVSVYDNPVDYSMLPLLCKNT